MFLDMGGGGFFAQKLVGVHIIFRVSFVQPSKVIFIIEIRLYLERILPEADNVGRVLSRHLGSIYTNV